LRLAGSIPVSRTLQYPSQVKGNTMRNRKATRNFWTDDQMIDAVSAGMEAAAEYSGKSASVRTRIGNESAAAVLGCKATDVQAILTAWEAFNNA
jgi:hypothetical protein